MKLNVFRPGIALLSVMLFASGCQILPYVSPPSPVACTLEAKICPDGSAVGRVGPSCEFAPCPATPKPAPAPVPVPGPGAQCSGPSDQSCPTGTQCIQDCGPPVVRDGVPPAPYHCVDNVVAKNPRNCPICLASNSSIATPSGEVNVKDVTPGMRVWSRTAAGERIESTVIRVSRTPVPVNHQVVHLVLADKRNVWVSPGHPTASGTPVGNLRPGDPYDGSRVVSADLVAYWDGYTYDLLTDSETGQYWANGILLGSTLFGNE
ncbi:MAG: hypothetical protein WA001_04550 [Patescibacteria group bacterium]